jgi:hypothetical protein
LQGNFLANGSTEKHVEIIDFPGIIPRASEWVRVWRWRYVNYRYLQLRATLKGCTREIHCNMSSTFEFTIRVNSLNMSEFIIMINSRHILNLSIELIIKPQALDKTSCYKCNGTKREAGRGEVGRFSGFSKK